VKKHRNLVFDGPFAEICTQFIQYKHSMGYVYGVRETYAVKQIDDFFKSYQLEVPRLSQPMVQDYVDKREDESAQSQKHRISKIRQFAAFLQDLGYESYVIPKNKFQFNKSFTPFIFTRKQIDALILAADQMERISQYPQSHIIYPTLMRMLYGCGLRISEALSLSMAHVDLQKGIPMSESLIKYCASYISRMNFPPSYEGDFFPSPRKGMYQPVSIYSRFRYFLKQAGIEHGGRGMGPRLHDLRHTFAVHTLEQMVSQALDIYYALPILSTYLGHRSIESTEQYVRLTSAAHEGIIHALEPLYENLFPEVIEHEES
jgi:integrase/recombinase XerD